MDTNRVSAATVDELRVLLLPPTQRDAAAIGRLLTEAGIASQTCRSIAEVCDGILAGCGAVLVSEEAITAAPERLVHCVQQQEVWSDLSTIVLSRSGVESPKLTAVLPKLGNVSVLERPMRLTTMLSLIRSSLRGRHRQYQVRAQLVERDHSERMLRASEERLRLALQTGKLGVWELNPQTLEMACSPGCRRHYGHADAGEFTYAQLLSRVHPDDAQRVQDCIGDTVRRHTDYDIEYRVIWGDGSVHWVLVRGRPTLTENGAVPRLVGVTLDVTDRKLAEERRASLLEAERSARSEAERAGRMKDEFLATLSHELRTPLNAILGWSQILIDEPHQSAPVSEGLQAIERNARAQTQIIEDLLDMNRIVSGKVRLEVRPIDLAAVVQSAVETVRPAALAKNVTLNVRLDPNSNDASGDPNRLQQVFWNLLSNAVKFTPPGGRVTVTMTRAAGAIEVSVSDTGEGIAPEFLPHMFDRFRQADASMSRRHGGLGLGLAIGRQLIELHGGTIRASSAGKGKGATFTVALPLSVTQAEPDHSRPVRARVHPPANAEHDDIAGLRILVVDDEADARALMKRVLENFRAVVFTAASAQDGMAVVLGERPDLVISDIGMPGEDGYAFIRRVRALSPEALARTPAMALTAYARVEDRATAMQAGYHAHLTKPVEAKRLVSAIASLMHTARH